MELDVEEKVLSWKENVEARELDCDFPTHP